MRVLIVRHAIAEGREEFALTGKPDSERPLTDDGRKKMRRAARGLPYVSSHIHLVATSPYVRAQQTAELVAEAYEDAKRAVWPELVPEGHPSEVLRRLRSLRGADTVALVGHQPSLGRLIGYLLTGSAHDFAELKKGAACLLELGDRKESGQATLLASTPPSLLRVLGRHP